MAEGRRGIEVRASLRSAEFFHSFSFHQTIKFSLTQIMMEITQFNITTKRAAPEIAGSVWWFVLLIVCIGLAVIGACVITFYVVSNLRKATNRIQSGLN